MEDKMTNQDRGTMFLAICLLFALLARGKELSFMAVVEYVLSIAWEVLSIVYMMSKD